MTFLLRKKALINYPMAAICKFLLYHNGDDQTTEKDKDNLFCPTFYHLSPQPQSFYYCQKIDDKNDEEKTLHSICVIRYLIEIWEKLFMYRFPNTECILYL